jgi:hypothetical protein
MTSAVLIWKSDGNYFSILDLDVGVLAPAFPPNTMNEDVAAEHNEDVAFVFLFTVRMRTFC